MGLGELSPHHSLGLCVVELAAQHEFGGIRFCSSLVSLSGDLVLPLAWVIWESRHGGYVRAGPAPCQCNPWESWSCPSKFGGIDLEELALPLAWVVWETWPHTLFRWRRRADQRLRRGRVRDLALHLTWPEGELVLVTGMQEAWQADSSTTT